MRVLHLKTDDGGNTRGGLSRDGIFLTTPHTDNILEWEQKNLKPNTDYACILVEIPDGYALGDKPPREMPDGPCQILSGYITWLDGAKEAANRDNGRVYVYPIQDEPEPEPKSATIEVDGKVYDAEWVRDAVRFVELFGKLKENCTNETE